MFSRFFSPMRRASPPAGHDDARGRRAAVAVCLLPLLGISAATAALLLGSPPPGPLGWAAGAAGLVAHTWLLGGVARRVEGRR